MKKGDKGKKILGVFVFLMFLGSIFSGVVAATTYNPQAAVNYADTWWNGRNPNYHAYSSEGGDCATLQWNSVTNSNADKYLYDMGIATGQSVGYYEPYQMQLDSELHNIKAPNQPPTAIIDSITPDPAVQGTDTVSFSFTGHGTDPDGTVEAYNWSSSIDGPLSTSTAFTKPASELSVGTHTFYFKVQDNDGTWSTEDTEDLTIYPVNVPPTAIIDSIAPNPAEQGSDTVSFRGHGTDIDGTVVAYNWSSSIDGQLSTSAAFTKPASALSVGTHAIYFKVQDNDGAWSTEDTEDLTIYLANVAPTAIIDSITPDPAELGTDTVSFSGHGTDIDGTVVAYNWSSSIDGQLSTSAAFTKPASELSVGTHTIYFKVQDNDGTWSTEDTEDLTIYPANIAPTPTPTPTSTHDMVVTNVNTTPSSPDLEQPTVIYVTVTNEGEQQEDNVSVKVYVDSAQIGSTQYISLAPGSSNTTTFLWTPTTAKAYSVKGEVEIVNGEIDVKDNTKRVRVRVSAAPTPTPESIQNTALDDDPLHQLPATSGKISYFCPDCCSTSAWSEPLGVSCGADDAAKHWFVAMRWPYYDPCTGFSDSNAKSWWHNKKVLVTNPTNGKQVVLAAKDWGPAAWTGRVIDVSKTAIDALGAVTDDTVNIEFADQSAELGVADVVKFSMGNWVRTTDELNVREQPKLSGEFIWTAPKGSLGVVIDGPQSDSGFTWYQIRYDYAPNDPKPTVIGWSSDHRLETHSTPSPPPKFLTLPFTDPSIKIQQGWIYHWRPDEPNAHKGIDYIKTSSSGWQSFDVVAAADGRAMWAETSSYGNIVRIQHNEKDYEGNNYFTLYAHLESVAEGIPKKQPNDENYASWKDVTRGEYIGKSGETGAQGTGIHLHFEAQRKAYVNYKTDPYDLYKIRNSYPGWESYTNSGSRYLWTTDPPITPSVNQPPIAHASDLSNQPDVMHPDTLYEVTAKYYDPDGRTNLYLCTLGLSHPSDGIMMGWSEDLKMPIEDSPYITYLDVVYTQITDSYEGYQLTWKFKLSDTWPEAENCIDFCVLATDDDGLRSELDCDNTDASFVAQQTGSIYATSNPSGANVYLDGTYKGTSPLTISNVPVGQHTVKFTKTGYNDCEKTVTVVANQQTNVHCDLTQQVGSIYATSNPSGANVYLDGTYKGVSPLTISNVPVGQHTVKFTKTGYNDCEKTVTVVANQQTNVHCDLTQQVGSIYATSNPSGANVYLDGTYRGVSPLTISNVPVGQHTVKFTKTGYNDCEKTVTVVANQQTNVYCDLTQQVGSIYATSTPSGATIYLDGSYIGGQTPYTITNVPAGVHTIGLSLAGYQDWSTNVQVTAGETSYVHATLSPIPPERTITFYTDPAAGGTLTFDGSIYSNGQSTTKTDGSYSVSTNPASNYAFDHWSTTGGMSVANPNAQSTTATVGGDGTIKAWFNYLPESSWTFMIYLDGDNDLEGAGIDDFMEMSSVGSTSDVDIVVQFDRIPGVSSAYGDWTDCKRFHVTSGMTPMPGNALINLGECNMGDPNTLSDFVDWTMTEFPADNYALILWNHGDGWKSINTWVPWAADIKDAKDAGLSRGICVDITNNDYLSLQETEQALTGKYVQLLGYDACLMHMVEVVYQVRTNAGVSVGSEESEPGDGWPYDTILTDLTGTPTMNADALGTVIVDRYMASYPTPNDLTQSAMDNSALPNLVAAVDNLAQALMTEINGGHWTQVQQARSETEEIYYNYYIDLYHFAEMVDTYVPGAAAEAQAVMNAVSGSVYEAHGSSVPNDHGLSIYYPRVEGEYSASYDSTAFASDTEWDEFLKKYYEGPVCEGTATSCGIYPNCENCNEDDGCYPYGNGCEERDYYCESNEAGCNYTYSNRHNDGWMDTGSTRWVDVNECQEKEQKEQEYRDYYCFGGACTYSVTGTPRWIDTGTTRNKDDGTICDCTASNTLKRCYGGVCTDTGICDSTTCGADAACDGKEPGDSCGGGGTCDSNCKCRGQAVGEDTAVFRNGWWFVSKQDRTGTDWTKSFVWGSTGDKPVIGDIDNNGVVDAVLYRNGWWFVSKEDHTGTDWTKSFVWGSPGDKPVIGDIDNNGVVDAVLYRNGWWFVSKEDHTGTDWTKSFFWGGPDDIPIIGDIDNNGIVDAVLYRNGWWFVSKGDHTGTDWTKSFVWGSPGDIPVIGDIDNNGVVDAVLYRNGWWFVLKGDHTGTDWTKSFVWGSPGDIPVVGDIG